jgi:hypothetical protein
MFQGRDFWPEQRVNRRGTPIIPFCGKTGNTADGGLLAAVHAFRHDRGNRIEAAANAAG